MWWYSPLLQPSESLAKATALVSNATDLNGCRPVFMSYFFSRCYFHRSFVYFAAVIGWTLHWGPFPIRWSYRACGHMPFVSRDSFGRCALLGISMIMYKEREELGFKRTHSTEYIQHSINSTRLWNSFYQQDLSVQHPGGRLRSSTHLVGVLELMWEAPALPMMKRYENTKRFRQLLWSQFCSISTFKFILVLLCSMIPCISSSWRYDAWIAICVCVCHVMTLAGLGVT